ncbi:hypothetical protein T11_9271 [Trichinella zimbabwensis]|uniref:Uncharacterized protein n=1 Tax=Trichinella zimbabwensis TaxID=268475 RepID=A0A0V1HM88_9BILA|nr:hypothetical protein T11_9271 [Trichinella zimbabwensis]
MDLDPSQSNHHLEKSIQLLPLHQRLDSGEDLLTLPLTPQCLGTVIPRTSRLRWRTSSSFYGPQYGILCWFRSAQ